MTSYSTRSTGAGWLTGTITRNPEGLLLLAAGCALLMRKGAMVERRKAVILNASVARKETDTDEWRELATKIEASGTP